MPIIETHVIEEFYDGERVSSEEIEVDVTVEVVEYALHDRMRRWYAANRAFLALASPTTAQNASQVKAMTQQLQAFIRFALPDLLTDEKID